MCDWYCNVSFQELYGWTMDAIVKEIGLKNNCKYCMQCAHIHYSSAVEFRGIFKGSFTLSGSEFFFNLCRCSMWTLNWIKLKLSISLSLQYKRTLTLYYIKWPIAGTFCGVFRRQALDRGAMLLKCNKIVTGTEKRCRFYDVNFPENVKMAVPLIYGI